MKNLVICGTSGVGKTFLEEYLEQQNISWQLPKYFDRENRSGERKDKNVSLSQKEWMNVRKEFFFTLTYNGHNYGWKRFDFREGVPSTLAITLGSLKDFLKKNPDFIPILLWVEKNNLKLLERRMKNRGETIEKIKQRLELARDEIKKGDEYKKIVKNNNGLIVIVKNNATVFKELIPKVRMLTLSTIG